MDLKKGHKIEVHIEKLIYGGAGLARIEGRVVFVDFAAPDDHLEVEIIEVKKNFARARISKILRPSPHRVQPSCSVFGSCGGCQWQHVTYKEQIQAKQKILNEVLARFLPGETIELSPMLESPNQLHYRNRIQVRHQRGQWGFYGKGSHELVAIESCPIAEESLNETLSQLKGEAKKEGKYRLQVGFDGRVTTTLIEEEEEPLGFAQINNAQNQQLQQRILSLYRSVAGVPVIDLYGGYGNLSLPIAEAFPATQIECVEWNKKAVAEGIFLAEKKGFQKVRFTQGDVAAYLQRLSIPKDAFVVLDPPRDGCDAIVIRELADQGPAILVYVSCDPMTWGRDAQVFLKQVRQRGYNYRIATMQGLDMFPQTDHIEVFSVFERMD